MKACLNIFIHVMFVLIGSIMIVMGIFAGILTNADDYLSNIKLSILLIFYRYSFIIVGFILILVASTGSCFYRTSKYQISSLFFVWMSAIVIQLTVMKCISLNSVQMEEYLTKSTLNLVQRDYGEVKSSTYLIEAIQNTFRCCGVNDFSDWKTSKFSGNYREINEFSFTESFNIPRSCYSQKSDGVVVVKTYNPNIFRVGCKKKVMEMINANRFLIGFIPWFVIGLECITMLALGILYCRAKSTPKITPIYANRRACYRD